MSYPVNEAYIESEAANAARRLEKEIEEYYFEAHCYNTEAEDGGSLCDMVKFETFRTMVLDELTAKEVKKANV